MADPPLDPQVWMRQTEALRRIAHAIVGDPDLADDVLQASWVTALGHPEKARDEGWLKRVVRSRAIDALRKRRAEPVSSGVDLDTCSATQHTAEAVAENLEMHRLLVEAVEQLSDPYRSTVALVYFEGWSVKKVAQVQAVSISTVHTRLQRAIEQLRSKLRQSGKGQDARAWAPALLNFAKGPSQPPLALGVFRLSSISASLLAISLSKLLVIVAIAVLALVGLWLIQEPTGNAVLPGDSLTPIADSARLVDAADRVSGTGPDGGRVTIAETDEEASEPDRSELKPALIAQVQWHDGTPAQGIGVIAEQPYDSISDFRRFLATTDEQGQAVFPSLPTGTIYLRTNRAPVGVGERFEVIEGETREGSIRLPLGVSVEGAVVDFGGVPVSGAEVWMCTPSAGWTKDERIAVTDVAGRFRASGIPRGFSLGARAVGHRRSELVDLDELDTTAGPVEVNLRVAVGGAELNVRVVDVFGEPLPEVPVVAGIVLGRVDERADGSTIEQWSSPQGTTDSQGQVQFVGLEPGELTVYASAPNRTVASSTTQVAQGISSEIELTLGEGASLEGTILGLDGEPLANGTVCVFEERLKEMFLGMGQVDYDGAFGYSAASIDREGRYKLENVPTGSVHVYAMAPLSGRLQGRTQHLTFVRESMSLAEGELETWDVQLTEGRVIEGVAVYADGSPIKNTFINLKRLDDSEGSDEYKFIRTFHTGDGGFRFVQLEEGVYEVQVQTVGLPIGSTELRRAGIRPNGLPLRLVADFVAPENTQASRVRLRVSQSLDAPAGGLGMQLQRRDGVYSWTTAEEQDGVFTATATSPGTYAPKVLRGDRVVWVGEEFELVGGEDLDLGAIDLGAGASLSVQVRYPQGSLGRPVRMDLSPEGTWSTEQIELEGRRTVDLVGLMPRTYSLALKGDGYVRESRKIELAEGETCEIRFELEAAVKVPFSVQEVFPQPMLVQILDLANNRTSYTYEAKPRAPTPSRFRHHAWLAPGRYALLVELGDGRTERREFEIGSLLEGDAPEISIDWL